MAPKKKPRFGVPSRDWEQPGDFYVDRGWMCYYTDDGAKVSGKFYIAKALHGSEDFVARPDEAIKTMIAGHQAKRKCDAQAGGGPDANRGKRAKATEAATVAAADGHEATSPKRSPIPVTPMNISVGRNRDYDAERAAREKNRQSKKELAHLLEEFEKLRSGINDDYERGLGASESVADDESSLDDAEEALEAANVLQIFSRGIFRRLGNVEVGGSEMLAFAAAVLQQSLDKSMGGLKAVVEPVEPNQQA